MIFGVYRCLDAKGRLLYVGFTGSLNERLATHKTSSPWFRRVDHTRFVVFNTQKEAQNAERKAIKEERPLYNKTNNPRWLEQQPPPCDRRCITIPIRLYRFAEKRMLEISEQTGRKPNFSHYVNLLLCREWKKAQTA